MLCSSEEFKNWVLEVSIVRVIILSASTGFLWGLRYGDAWIRFTRLQWFFLIFNLTTSNKTYSWNHVSQKLQYFWFAIIKIMWKMFLPCCQFWSFYISTTCRYNHSTRFARLEPQYLLYKAEKEKWKPCKVDSDISNVISHEIKICDKFNISKRRKLLPSILDQEQKKKKKWADAR